MATIEELQAEIEELQKRLDVFESKTGFMSAKVMRERAEEWIDRNPSAWHFIRSRAQKCLDSGSRFSIKRQIENLRDTPGIMSADDYKICNSFSPVFARILVAEMPELLERGLITLRRSKVDRFYK